MVEGVSRCGRRGSGGARALFARALAGALLLWGLVLAGCASSAEDGGGSSQGSGTVPGTWISGGQTGSLMPTCGLSPLAREQGVPASASSFVVYTSGCEAAPSSELALFDAQGRPVPVQTRSLGAGIVLVTPAGGLAPGSYVLGGEAPLEPEPEPDTDAGVDGDSDAGASTGSDGASGPAAVEGETLSVLAPSAAPTRLGELRQTAGACSAALDLILDPAIDPYLPSLALDLRVDDSAPQRVVEFGTLAVSGRTARVAVPLWLLPAGAMHTVTLQAVLAGEDVAIAPATLTLTCAEMTVSEAPVTRAAPPSADTRGCSALGRTAGSDWLLAFLALLGLYRRPTRRPTG